MWIIIGRHSTNISDFCTIGDVMELFEAKSKDFGGLCDVGATACTGPWARGQRGHGVPLCSSFESRLVQSN